MNCRDLLSAVSEYLDAEARPELRIELEEHIRRCPTCRVQVRTLDRTITLVRRLEDGRAQREMVVRLRQRIVRIDRG